MTQFIVHVIDDDQAVRDSLEALLTVSGYAVMTFGSAETFLARLDHQSVVAAAGCILLDLHMPGMSGLDLLRILAIRPQRMPVLLLSASRDPRLKEEARDLGAALWLAKPVAHDALRDAIENLRRGGSWAGGA